MASNERNVEVSVEYSSNVQDGIQKDLDAMRRLRSEMERADGGSGGGSGGSGSSGGGGFGSGSSGGGGFSGGGESSGGGGFGSGSSGGGGFSGGGGSSSPRDFYGDIDRIRGYSQQSPDVAAFQAQVLQQQIYKSMREGEESATQDLIDELRALTREIGSIRESRETGGGTLIAKMLQDLNRATGINTIAQNIQQGSVLGAAGSIGGAAIGAFFGSPTTGAALGSTVGNAAQGLVNSVPVGSLQLANEYAARLGDFGIEGDVGPDSLTALRGGGGLYGYDNQETLRTMDTLRGLNVRSDGPDEAARLVEGLQAVSRALGENTDALAQTYAAYNRAGGEGSTQEYFAERVAEAIAIGFEENKGDYLEMMASMQTQMLHRSGQEVGDETLRLLSQVALGITGGDEDSVFAQNPAMLQEALMGMQGLGSAADMNSARTGMLLTMGDARLDTVSSTFALPGQSMQQGMTLLERGMNLGIRPEGVSYRDSLFYDPSSENANALTQGQRAGNQSIMRMLFPELSASQMRAYTDFMDNGGASQFRTEDGQIDYGAAETELNRLIDESDNSEAAQLRRLQAETNSQLQALNAEFTAAYVSSMDTIAKVLVAIEPAVKQIGEGIGVVAEKIGLVAGLIGAPAEGATQSDNYLTRVRGNMHQNYENIMTGNSFFDSMITLNPGYKLGNFGRAVTQSLLGSEIQATSAGGFSAPGGASILGGLSTEGFDRTYLGGISTEGFDRTYREQSRSGKGERSCGGDLGTEEQRQQVERLVTSQENATKSQDDLRTVHYPRLNQVLEDLLPHLEQIAIAMALEAKDASKGGGGSTGGGAGTSRGSGSGQSVAAGTGGSRAGRITALEDADPRILAFLDTIAHAEGGEYDNIFGGSRFSGTGDHPRQVVNAGGYSSDAAGRYQFLSTTWDEVAGGMGLSDFSPESQDLAAIEYMRQRGVTNYILNDDIDGALNKAAPIWASLPTAAGNSYYGQPVKPMDELLDVYEASLEQQTSRQGSVSMANHVVINVGAGANPQEVQAAVESGLLSAKDQIIDSDTFGNAGKPSRLPQVGKR